MASLVGAKILQFEIMEELGHGGMGVVYKAWDSRLDRLVAIKTIRGEANMETRRRFAEEARAATRLNHPYLCQLLDVLEIDEELLIVMEYLQGETLREEIAGRRLRAGEAIRIASETAEGLREAHLQGIIHRDIKPSNIFLTRSGHVKLLDFGLVRWIDPAAPVSGSSAETVEPPLTRSGQSVGTAGYMAPEQALGRRVDERVDIFSLGIVMFEMLTGVHPYAGATPAEHFHRLFTQSPPRLRSCDPGISGDLDALVDSMIAREPEGRPASMEAVYRELIEIQGTTPPAGIATPLPPGLAGKASARMPPPKTHYTRSGEVNVAYQVIGDGPFDLVYVPGWISHLEYGWEQPRVANFFRRLASFSRLILFDKRGTGLSDRVFGYPTLEDRMDDVRAVMDAVGSGRAAVFGMSEGGNMSVLFAATHPERTIALAICGSFAKRVWSPEYPWAPTPEERNKWYELLEHEWGGIVDLETLAPSAVRDQEFAAWWSRYLRLGASPGAALQLARFNTQIDTRDILPAIKVPTLVLHRRDDRDVNVEEGRYIARQIPGAKFIELPGEDHLVYAGDSQRVLDEVEQFLVSVRSSAVDLDRILTTIVSAAVEDASCVDLAGDLFKQQLTRYRGQQMVTDRPDRFLASFDGPARAVRAACALAAAARAHGLAIRCGIHTGECELAGPEGGQLRGLPLTIAGELSSDGPPYRVLVSRTVKDLVSAPGLRFVEDGVRRLPGIPDEWQVFIAEAL